MGWWLLTGAHRYDETISQFQGRILPKHHPMSKKVARVLQRLVPVSGLEDLKWEVFVVDDPAMKNAFVIPGCATPPFPLLPSPYPSKITFILEGARESGFRSKKDDGNTADHKRETTAEKCLSLGIVTCPVPHALAVVRIDR